MIISRKKSPPNPNIRINGLAVERVSSFRLLGVTISEDLTWSNHVTTTCLRAKRLLGRVYRTFGKASSRTLAYIYKVIVRPILDHASCVWDPQHLVHQTRLERVQSFASKIVTKRWRESPTLLKEELGWEPLKVRREFQKLCVCRKILSGESLIKYNSFQPHPRKSKNLNDKALFRPRVRTKQHEASFFMSVVPIWNSLPDRIVSCSTATSFKWCLQQYLFQRN